MNIKDSANLNAYRNIIYENNEGGAGGSGVIEGGAGASGIEIHTSAQIAAFNDIAYLSNSGGPGGSSTGIPGIGGVGVLHQGYSDYASHNIHFEENKGGSGGGGHGVHLSGAALEACNDIFLKYNYGFSGTTNFSGDGVEIESGSSLIAQNNISFIHNKSSAESSALGVGVKEDCSAHLQCSHLNYVINCSSNNENILGEPALGAGLSGFYDNEPAMIHKQNIGSCMISACP